MKLPYDSIFNPDNINKKSMNVIAEALELYLDEFLEVMIIPEDIMKDHGEDIHKAIHLTKKLIKKLRNGDKSVFKDVE